MNGAGSLIQGGANLSLQSDSNACFYLAARLFDFVRKDASVTSSDGGTQGPTRSPSTGAARMGSVMGAYLSVLHVQGGGLGAHELRGVTSNKQPSRSEYREKERKKERGGELKCCGRKEGRGRAQLSQHSKAQTEPVRHTHTHMHTQLLCHYPNPKPSEVLLVLSLNPAHFFYYYSWSL